MLRISVLLIFSSLFSLGLSAQEKWDLQKCIDYALQNNLSVQQSKLNIERAEIGLTQSKYALLPNLNAQATYGYNFGQRIDPFTNQFATQRVLTNNLFMSSSLDIFNGFSKVNTIKRNEADMVASEYDLKTIQNDISLQLCLAYLQILRNKENAAIAQEQLTLTQSQVDRTQILVDAGQLPQGTLYDAQAQAAQEELNLVNAENAIVLARLNLTQIMQLTPQEAEEFEIVTPDLSDEGTELLNNSAMDIYIRAKQEMPQIQAVEQRKTAAEYDLKVANGNLYPNLSLSGSVGSGYSGANRIIVGEGSNVGFVPIGQVQGTGAPVVTIQEQTIYNDGDFKTKSFTDQLSDNFNQNIQLNLVIPIFNGLAARSNVNRAKINRLDAEITYAQVSNQLRFDVEQAYADAKAAMNSYLAAQKAVMALEESFNYGQVRYDQGVINTVQFNDIKTQYTNAQSSMTNSKYDFVFRTKILDFYLGNPITL
ncbi:TolC family protein [Cryomorpha ignava]|uniref:TolC family protein n=1 Tax=Cryomorpha ignava TaxID=101383 RepID=A0A7K3WUI3_9FLAO|nr:TolC family protein [Cryomorpha ignava]NEN25164.1 TolC family protein [Cryomorpha ignava]